MQITLVPVCCLIAFSIYKKVSNVLFGPAHHFVEDLGSINDLRLVAIENFSYLTSNKSLARAGRPIQNHSLAVLLPVLLNHRLWVSSRVKGAPKYFCKLFIKSSNSKTFKVEVLFEQ